MSVRFDGRLFAQRKLENVAQQATQWKLERHRQPKIVSFFPYEDHASVAYSKLKRRDAQQVGIEYDARPLSLRLPRSVWLHQMREVLADKMVDGVMVQKPAAQRYMEVTGHGYEHFSRWWDGISESIPPEKDVDCLSPLSLFSLEKETSRDSLTGLVLPATAQAVIDIALDLSWGLENLRKKKVVVIGRSVIVGKPVSLAFGILGVSCELISSQADLGKILPEADVIVSASGKANLVQPSWVKEGSILIDVGAPFPEFADGCAEKAGAWTPVPGGVGPVTRACLLENLFRLI